MICFSDHCLMEGNFLLLGTSALDWVEIPPVLSLGALEKEVF